MSSLMSMVFTFLGATNHAKAFTFDGVLEIQIKLAKTEGIRLEDLDNP